MWKYRLWYNGELLEDSELLGYSYESKEEANEDAELIKEEYIRGWGFKDNVCEKDLFNIELKEV